MRIRSADALNSRSRAALLTSAGTTVFGQYWGRDTVQAGPYLSDGASWTIGP